ncbi:flagellar assembly protein FliH [Parashewanella curva]|uniref:Flagellar assembly protein FliH n=1 Tax=Parashewanella curva TaxID=2338552 RepID=A0A3L8Q1U9_9GAMM|nr:flagellar assembly protein FliH [Parashewanella curva]RLV61636.1 flagellar assembly protein FliH [Parashewanella curva]
MSSSNLDAVAEEFKHWQIPDVSEESSEKQNLFGRTQAQSLPQIEEESFTPPTLAEIEALQQQAEQEAREQGFQQGFNQGLEKGKLEGLEKGHEEGFAQGKEQGLEQGLAEAKEILLRLEQLVQQLEQPLSVVDTQIEASLVMLSSSLAKAIVATEIQTNPQHIHNVLRQGIESLPLKNQPVNVRLNPQDVELVEQAYSATMLEKKQWQFEADPSLSVGDCFIESQKSAVDLTVKNRTETVLVALTEQQYQLEKQLQQALLEQTQKAVAIPTQEVPTPNESSENQETQEQA